MKVRFAHSGSVMLMVVVLMSMLLVLCTRMWRTTAYVVDIAVQKQIYMQKKWATQGVLNCGIAACQAHFNAIYVHAVEQGGAATVPLHSYTCDIAHVKQFEQVVVFKVIDAQTIEVAGELMQKKKVVMSASCTVSTTKVVV